MRSNLYAAALAAVLGLTAGAVRADVVERTFEVGARGRLEVDTDVGSIEVSGYAGTRVEVRVARGGGRSEQLELEFSQEGTTVSIEGDMPRGRGGKVNVEYRIEVPRGFDLDLETGGGSVRVNDVDGEVHVDSAGGSLALGQLRGPVRARTAGGSIRLESSSADAELITAGGSIRLGDVGGRVRAVTAGGSIALEDVNGDVEARTAGGSIEVGRVTGSVKARTSGGSIRVKEVLGGVDATTSGGGVEAYLSQQPSMDSRLETSGGQVTVYLAPGIAVSVDARGGDGGVYSDFPLPGAGPEADHVRGDINGGGPRLDLRASDGVYLERR